ncbi:NitT/TauT family transport system substrate-binding protein [Chitinasiproducens palmae]|uniref:NitT/TauT family transport system substrate-binding protein n=2 Tax=Chitinasiproducens palmae TaxID=1770053 RepID=A0A1H2PPG8_9BURK|nr:NitT/TauT family transport system substrate-binding protein [Chitinasiproducens palmae]
MTFQAKLGSMWSLGRSALLMGGVAAALGTASTGAYAQNQAITYLLPAPASAVAFAPLMLAQKKGYFEQAGLTVRFVSVQGGADVGKQLAAGNGDLGGALGDTPIVLRPNGVKVKGVALLGGRTLHQLMIRSDRNVKNLTDLKGKTLTVIAYQDTSFYAAQAVLARAGLTRQDVAIQAAGPTGVWQQVAEGKADGLVGAPEWGIQIEQQGVKVDWKSTDTFFPGMAQAIMASDETIAKRPDMVKKFVGAVVRSLNEIKADPKAAAVAYTEAVPSYKGQEAFVEKVLTYYVKTVYPNQSKTGAFDPDRVSKLQDYYASKDIIRSKSPVNDLFTNQFVQ